MIDQLGDSLKEHEPLGRYTTLKIGGPADLFIDVHTSQELINVIQQAVRLGIRVFVLGGGSNILVGDKGFSGLVIKNSTSHISVIGAKGFIKRGTGKRKVYIEADSGVMMNKLVRYTIEEGLQGLEMHLGLPGSVGGALYMNSKWTHPSGYVGDAVQQATVITPKGEVCTMPKSYFRFGYDTSILQKNADIVAKVIFALSPNNIEDLWKIANTSVLYRRESQPQGVFSPGCTFRNISKVQAMALSTPKHTTSAGFLLDHAGVKGMTVGDAQVSAIHANFIINRGKATASDVVKLIEKVRAKVKEQFGVNLEEEIVRIGEF